MGGKNTNSFLGQSKYSPSETRQISRPVARTDYPATKNIPDFFPGYVKHSLIPEQHLLYFAYACVQSSIKLIPEAEALLDEIVIQLDSKGCQQILSVVNHRSKKFAKILGKYISHIFSHRKTFGNFMLLLRLFPFLISFFPRPDFWKLHTAIRRFIRQVFNQNPEEPKVRGSLLLQLGVLNFAQFCHINMGPYDWDKENRPLSADVALIRPKTTEGRKMKSKYNQVMRKYEKHTDRYYIYASRKWIMARVTCESVSEAERQLNLATGQLHKELYEEPWDDVMGYTR